MEGIAVEESIASSETKLCCSLLVLGGLPAQGSDVVSSEMLAFELPEVRIHLLEALQALFQ